MSNPGDADATTITSERQLADYIAVGCKPPERFTIGTEHEKFGFRRSDLVTPPYEPGGIRAVLEGMAAGGGWAPILDRGNPIGLNSTDKPNRLGDVTTGAISLEPAGQFELSGGLMRDLHGTRAEFETHFAEVRAAAEPLGLGFAPLGFHPTGTRESMPWMPKGRYALMRRYMPLVGSLGLDMMTRTCTVQVNLDYASEADMAAKLRVALALQPVASALFANSPFTEGKPNGFLSYRCQIWTDTDNDRSGIPPCMFEPGFGFERYVQWLLDVPMYFVFRDNRYIDVAGRSFRDFMAGKLDVPGVGQATIGDFADHMTTAFTDVRLKRFLEMRGSDAGSVEMMVAQSALWVGILYDPAALAAAQALVASRPWTDFVALRPLVPRTALDTRLVGDAAGTVRDLAREMVAIARDGLRARAIRDAEGRDETTHLAPLDALVAGGPTQAERWLERYHGVWRGDTSRIFSEAAI